MTTTKHTVGCETQEVFHEMRTILDVLRNLPDLYVHEQQAIADKQTGSAMCNKIRASKLTLAADYLHAATINLHAIEHYAQTTRKLMRDTAWVLGADWPQDDQPSSKPDDLVAAIARALDDRGADEAAQLVRDTDPDDDLWNNYLGPMLDSLEDDYTTMARENRSDPDHPSED